MNVLHATSAEIFGRETVISRLLNAPRKLVFRVWTQPEHIARWWGPNGFTTTTHSMDVRPGGVWRFIMHGPDGTDYPNHVTYLEVVPPERLVYEHRGDDEQAEALFTTTVTFEATGDQTKVTMRGLFQSAEVLQQLVERVGALEGGRQTITRMAEYVEAL